jgi:Fur family peroxide stress response transcriptional regulator
MTQARKKHSKKRDAILEAIRSTTAHPGAQWVYNKLKPRIPDLALGTVYRNIAVFLRENSVVSLGVVRGEERFDGCVEPHPHCVCSRCGRVADLPCPDTETSKLIEGGLAKSMENFTIDYRKTVFYGLCAECAGRTMKVSL